MLNQKIEVCFIFVNFVAYEQTLKKITMAEVTIKYIIDGVDEITQHYNDVDVLPDNDDVSDGFIEIVGEQPTREERRS